jgi:hypothetical protein
VLALEEWIYWLSSAKLCAVHIERFAHPSGAKNLYAVVALPVAQWQN